MAITTLAGIISGLQPPVYFNKANSAAWGPVDSLWGLSGNPASGGFDTTLNGVALSNAVVGQLHWNDPATGNAYLARMQAAMSNSTSGVPGSLMLCDRLWHNGGIDITGASNPQSVTFPGLPARDINGSSNGEGVLLAVEIQISITSTVAPTITVGYTNSAGTAGRTSTNINPWATNQSTFTFPLMSLDVGDTGIRSIQSVSIGGSATAGTVNLVLFRPIALLDLGTSYRSGAIDGVTGGLPQMFNGSVPFIVPDTGGFNGGETFQGELQFTWG